MYIDKCKYDDVFIYTCVYLGKSFPLKPLIILMEHGCKVEGLRARRNKVLTIYGVICRHFFNSIAISLRPPFAILSFCLEFSVSFSSRSLNNAYACLSLSSAFQLSPIFYLFPFAKSNCPVTINS